MQLSFKLAIAIAIALLSIAALAALALVANQTAAAADPALLGTWRWVRFEDIAKDGTVTRQYAEHPKGYIVYDTTGHVHIQIMRNPPPERFVSGDPRNPSDAEARGLYQSYVAYFGTYRVDKAKGVLTHVVEGSSNPFFTGTDQRRPYRVMGDRLVIEATDPNDGTHYYRELERVR